LLREEFRNFFGGFPMDAHPMAMLSSAVSALSTFYQGEDDIHDPKDVAVSTVRLIAKLPTIAAAAYKKSIGQPFVYPDNSLDYESNFLRMMFAVPAEPYVVDEEVAKALRVLLILHADHEQNCSTSTVRMVGSSHANMYASISAGIAALWGPLHGGANQEVLEMLNAIVADGGDVGRYVDKAKDPNDPFRLMGFGHRVYKNYDPRARIIKAAADSLLAKLGADDHLFRVALELEHVALHDPYFVERKLYPNVDFYSGLIYRALGIPTEMFTVMFAIGRLPGWIAQWREMMADPGFRIGRPRQLYIGAGERAYVPIRER
ncbi:MAG TPA: citrate synthase, partial [Candidatus Limnocylindrales bacterium]|nr:citrate synthase [Candidatus Limnocylindrales bacterium]